MSRIYTVSQVTGYIRRMFEEDYVLGSVSIRGEVSNCKYHSSGHLYFTLKDASAAISCVMFASARKSTDPRLEEGMQVTASGGIRVYERDGRYQLYVTGLETQGIGELYRIFEQRRREMEEMGMFSAEYKKPIPKYCRTVGVVTASTGAAIHDIITVSHRRNPYVQLILSPAQVQGREAAGSIARAIRRLEACRPDCIIVGRGGGAMEDLWAFNEEEVAQAIFDCPVPVISAVGHETDFTIADFVADLRAPTPSAAAELAVFDIAAFDQLLDGYWDELAGQMEYCLEQGRNRVEKVWLALRALHPGSRLLRYREILGLLEERLAAGTTALLEKRRTAVEQSALALRSRHPSGLLLQRKEELDRGRIRLSAAAAGQVKEYMHRLEVLSGRLDASSPLARLGAGYAYVTDTGGRQVRGIKELPEDRLLKIHWQDGSAKARVLETVTGEGDEDKRSTGRTAAQRPGFWKR